MDWGSLLVGAELTEKRWKIPVGEKAYWGRYEEGDHSLGGYYVIQMREDFKYRIGWTPKEMDVPKVAKKGEFLSIPVIPVGSGAFGIKTFANYTEAREAFGKLSRKNEIERVREAINSDKEAYLERVEESDKNKEDGIFDGEIEFHDGSILEFAGVFSSTEDAITKAKEMTVEEMISNGLIKHLEMERR